MPSQSAQPVRIVRFALSRPRTVLLVWLGLVALAAVFALQLDGALTAGGFSDPRSQSASAQALIQKAFGDEPNQSLVVLDAGNPVSAAEISSAESVLRDNGATTIQGPTANPALASKNGHTVVLVAGFGGSNATVQNKTPAIQAALERRVDVSSYLTGQPALDYELNAHSKEDATRAELIAFPVLIVVLLFVFRSVAATLIPLVMAGSALAASEAIGYLATRFTDISILYTNIVSMVGLAVAVDYSLFIIKRYREELDAGAAPADAVRIAFATAGRSVLFSGVAVAVALVALFIPGLMAFTSIALGGIVVTVVALLLSLTALPAALVLLGHRISWGAIRLLARPAREARAPRRSPSRARAAVPGLIAALVLIAIALPTLGISLQSPVASATILPPADKARIGLDVAEKRVGNHGLFPLQVVVSAPRTIPVQRFLDELQDVTSFAAHRADVGGAVSAITIARTTQGLAPAALASVVQSTKSIPSALSSLLAEHDGRWVGRVIVTAADSPDSVGAHRLVEALRSEPVPGDATVVVAGATAQGLDFDSALEASIPWIIAFVFVLTFVMLLIAFRSAVLPLLALAFNSLVVGASLGVLTVFTRLTTNEPINSVTPVLLFAVMFGLSMDYMVIIISRVIESFRAGATFDAAVTQGTTRTRGMINSAAIIMVAVFASFTSAQISIVREIGIGLGIAVILDALVIRMLVMPAVLRLIGARALPATASRSDSAPATTPLAPALPAGK